MGLERVDAEADHLDAAAVELGLDACHLTELGRADGREVLGVGEQHTPTVAEPLVERDRPLRGLGDEVGGFVTQLQRRCAPIHLVLLCSVRTSWSSVRSIASGGSESVEDEPP